jgi:YD repeat-containing protein
MKGSILLVVVPVSRIPFFWLTSILFVIPLRALYQISEQISGCFCVRYLIRHRLSSEEKLRATGNRASLRHSILMEVALMIRAGSKWLLSLILFFVASTEAQAQTATYHLHGDSGVFQIKTQDPSATITAVQSAELKGLTGEFLVQDFPTSGFEPNGTGTIPAGSTVTYTLWMKKTATAGVMFPRAKLFLNSATGALFCTVTGTTALTTTLTEYTLTCTTTAPIVMISPKQFYLWVGVNITTGSGNTRVKAEIDMGGTLNGADDSRVQIPMPPTAIISSLSPSSGAIGTVVTIDGANFGDSQGLGKVTFNGVAATPSSWSDTVIVAPVPSGATTGPVIVTTSPIPSNALTFTVGTSSPGTISGSVTRNSDGSSISGALVEALQSNVVKGSATSSANGAYSISGLSPGTYDVRVSASGYITSTTTGIVVSSGTTTTVNVALGAVPSISGLSPSSGTVGASVTVSGSGFGPTQGSSTVKFNNITATPTGWSDATVTAPVPTGATTGPVVITVAGTASNGVTFTVLVPGTISGTITRASDGSAINGATVQALQGTTVVGTSTTNATGNYTLSNLTAGTYTIQASASGYVQKSQAGVVVTAGATATVNLGLDSTPLPITYIYDAVGRLTAVVDPAGETARYAYDAVGNLLLISRQSSALVSVIEFTPSGGTVGDSVSIFGTGFSDTASQNAVKFNGVTATVLSATATKIVATVSAGTSTGPITVTAPAGSATSSTSFAITSSNGSPTISGFTPTIGVPGTSVTISGTNFQSDIASDKVAFNSIQGVVNSATGTSVVASVPSAGSGRVSISTPNGRAESAADFYIVPPPYAAADVQVTDRLTFGAAKSVTMSTPNKIGLILFDGIAGHRISLNMTNVTFTYCFVGIYKPNSTQLASTLINTGQGFIEPIVLPFTGTYTVRISQNSAAGSMTLTVYDVVDVAGTITAGGPPVTVSLPNAGQIARLTFTDTAGHSVKLTTSNVTVAGPVNIIFVKPDGSSFDSTYVNGSAAVYETLPLPVSGTYTIITDPIWGYTGNLTFTLSDLPPDYTSPISMGGPAISVSLPTPEQKARLTFSATAGQRMSMLMDNITITQSTVWVIGPGLAFSFTAVPNATFLEPVSLPSTGSYTIIIDPTGTYTGSMTVSIYNVVDVTGNMTPGGSSSSLTMSTPGQKAQITFSGTTGRQVSLRLTNTTITSTNVSITSPGGSLLVPVTTITSPGGFIDTKALPSTGDYTILLDPGFNYTGTTTVSLYDVVDVTGNITIGGAAVNVTTTVPGQNGRLTFTGAANQKVTVNLASNTMGAVTVSLVKLDGTVLTSATSSSASFSLAKTTLPAAGTYTIKIDPSGANTGSISVSATSP